MRKPSSISWALLLVFGIMACPCPAAAERADNAHAKRLRRSTTEKLLQIIGRSSPTLAASLHRQTDLRAEMGEARYHDALTHVAAFGKSTDQATPRTPYPSRNSSKNG